MNKKIQDMSPMEQEDITIELNKVWNKTGNVDILKERKLINEKKSYLSLKNRRSILLMAELIDNKMIKETNKGIKLITK